MKTNIKFLFLIFSLLILSCQSEILESNSSEQGDELTKMKQALKELGYSNEKIEISDNAFILEGDMVLPFKAMNDKNKQAFGGSEASGAPWKTVSQTNVSNIKVKLSPTSNWNYGGLNFESIIEDALDNWENLSQAKVAFSIITSGTPDITIYEDSDPNIPSSFNYGGLTQVWSNLHPSKAAAAMIPNNTISSGKPGNIISINQSWGSGMTHNRWEKIITHEIGHTLGFHHTDWNSSDFYSNPTNVPGTNTNDVNSVMNANPTNHNWTPWVGFSNNDIKAARLLYPDNATSSFTSQGTGTESGGYLPVDFNFDYFYHYSLEIYAKVNSGTWNLIDTIQYPTDQKTILLPTDEGPGIVSMKVRSKSYIGNEYSPYSQAISFYFQGSIPDDCQPTFPCENY